MYVAPNALGMGKIILLNAVKLVQKDFEFPVKRKKDYTKTTTAKQN